jgi:hypothetical protein
LNNREKKLLQDIKIKDKEEAESEDTGEVNSPPGLEEQQTTNGVF